MQREADVSRKEPGFKLRAILYVGVFFISGFIFFGHINSAHAATFTWSGGGANNNFSTAANWGGTAPTGVSTDVLVFTGSTRLTPNNDLTSKTFASITFNAGGFTVGGNALTLAAGTTAISNTVGTNTISLNITFSTAAATISITASTTLTISGTINNGNLLITVNSAGTLNLNGVISGSSGLTKSTGTGTLTLAAANSYSGTTTINAGIIKLGATGSGLNAPLGTFNSGTTVASGAALDLAGFTLVTAEPLTLNGTGISGGGALMNSGGNATESGTITFATAASIVGGSGTIALTGTPASGTTAITFGGAAGGSIGTVIAGARNVIKADAGTWTLSGTNTYTGTTTISAGILNANATAALGNGANAGNTLIFNGGTLQAAGTITSPSTRGVTLTSTAIIDTNGQSISLAGTIGSAGGITKQGSGALTLAGTTTLGAALTVSSGTVTNSAAVSGTTMTVSNGATFTQGAATLAFTGAVTIGGGTSGIFTGSSSNVSVSTLTLNAGASFTTGANILTISGTGTPLSINSTGIFTITSGNIIKYTGNGATIICQSAGTIGYYDLQLLPSSSTAQTICAAATQTLLVTHNLTIGDGTNAGATAATNNPTINILGDFTIAANATFTKGTGTTSFKKNGTATLTDNTSGQDLGAVQLSTGGGYYRAVTIDHTKVPNTDQTNFPVLISGTYNGTGGIADLRTVANGGKVQNASGYDVGFYTSSDCSTGKMSWETETYTASTGVVTYWVRVPTVSHSADTIFYMCYGNSIITTDQQDKVNTWDTNYKGVWHLNDASTSTVSDSKNSNTGTKTAANEPIEIAGKIGKAQNWDGTGDYYIDNGNSSTLDAANNVTVSFWLKFPTTLTANTFYHVLAKSNISDGDRTNYAFVFNPSQDLFRFYYENTGTATYKYVETTFGQFNDGAWHYVTGVLSQNGANTDTSIYSNGSLLGTVTNTGNVGTTTATLGFGRDHAGENYTPDPSMTLDEVRVSGSVRSADWNMTEYNNQNSPSSFYTVGSESIGGNATLNLGSSAKLTSLTIDSSQTFSANGSNTLTITGTGTPLTINGTFTPSTGTVNYLGNGATIASGTYNNLGLKPSSSSAQVLSSGTLTVNGNLTIGDGTNAGATAATNNPTINLLGNFTIAANATYTKGSGTTTFGKSGTQTWTDSTSAGQDIGTVVLASSAFLQYRSVTIDHTKVPNTDQTNFPVLISGTYNGTGGIADLRTVANGGKVQNASGYDVGFYTSSDCSTGKMSWDTETYTASTGVVNYWVKVPTVSHTADTVFYMCYGNSIITTDQQDKTNTWDTNYKGVWHLNDTSTSTVSDSKNSNTGTKGGAGTPAEISGKIGNAQNWDGTGDYYIDNGNSSTLDSANNVTVSFWLRFPTTLTANTFYHVLAKSNISDGDRTNYAVAFNPSQNFLRFYYENTGTLTYKYVETNFSQFNDGAWHYVTGVLAQNGSTTDNTLFVNGSQVSTANNAGNVGTTTATFSLGRDHAGENYTPDPQMTLDEVRVSGSVRSADWNATEYNNQNAPSSFYTVGSETAAAVTTVNLGSSVKAATLTVGASQTFSANGSNTLTLTGTGTPLTVNGTFTVSTGTVTYLGNGATIANLTYNNLNLTPSGSTQQILPAGILTVNGTLTIGDGTNSGATAATNNPTINLLGNFTIAANATYTKGTGTTTFKSGTSQSWTDNTSGQDLGTVVIAVNTTNTTVSTVGTPQATGLTINASQALSLGSSTLILSSTGTPLTNSGTLTYSTSTVRYIGNGATITSLSGSGGTNGYYNLELKPSSSSQQIFSTGTVQVNNNLTVGGGNQGVTAATNNPTLNVLGTTTIASGATFTTGTGTWTQTGDMTVTGTLSGTASGTISSAGSVTGAGLINLTTAGTFEQRVGASKNFGPAGSLGWSFVNLTFGRSAGTPTITTQAAGTATITVSGTFNIGKAADAGATILDAGNKTWILSGTGTPLVFNASSTLTGNTSTIRYTGNGATSTPSTGYYNLELKPSSSSAHIFGAGTYTVGGNLVIGDGTNAGATAATNNPTINLLGNLTIAANSTYTKGSGTTTFKSGTSQTWTDSTSGQDLGAVQISVNSTNTTVNLGSGVRATSLTIDSAQTFSANGSNTLTLTGNGGSVFVQNGTFTPSTGTVDFSSAATTGTTVPALTYNNLTVNKASNTFTAAAGTLTVGGNLNVTNGTLNLTTNDPIATISGTTTIAGTLIASDSANLTIQGNWINNGTFTASTGTVVVVPANVSVAVLIGGSSVTTFNNFTAATPGSIIQFKNSQNAGFSGAFTITGVPSNPVSISSDLSGTQWNLSLTGTASLAFVNIKDSGCAGGTNSISTNDTVFDRGNNSGCWIFVFRGGGGQGVTSGGGSASGGGGQGEAGSGNGGDSGGGGGQGGGGQGGASSSP